MACSTTGKVQYDSEKAALKGLDKTIKYNPDYDGETYYCLYCNSWHIGRSQRKKKKKK